MLSSPKSTVAVPMNIEQPHAFNPGLNPVRQDRLIQPGTSLRVQKDTDGFNEHLSSVVAVSNVPEVNLTSTAATVIKSAVAQVNRRADAATSANNFNGAYQSFLLDGFTSPTTTVSAPASPSNTASAVCPARNGTAYISAANIEYEVVCNIDFSADILPSQFTQNFEGCVQKCDAYNYDQHHVLCVAAVFVPGRTVSGVDDCFLKSSLETKGAVRTVEGAIRVGYPSPTAKSSSSTHASVTTTKSSAATYSAPPEPQAGVTYASGNSVIAPKLGGTRLLGPSQDTPTTQYLDIGTPAGIQLPQSLLVTGVDGDLSTGYGISPQTGVLDVNSSTQSFLKPLQDTPHLSRDGGRGGYVNGEHLFIFCDTGVYGPPTASTDGDFRGFVSSSVAIDVGMNGLTGHPLTLQDGIGEWSDNVGRMRGFAPMTTAEQSYNQVMQGNGQRYAVWPESSLIPLNSESSLLYAPIVYDNVNMQTKAAIFTYTGAALLEVTAGGKGGPSAERIVNKIFDQDEVEYGCAGGIRSWGPSGVGGNDGNVYVFGIINGGVLIGRVAVDDVADRDSVGATRIAFCIMAADSYQSTNTGMAIHGVRRCRMDRQKLSSFRGPLWTLMSSIRRDT